MNNGVYNQSTNICGVALITILVLVGISTLLAVNIFQQEFTLLRKTTNILHAEQAILYAVSGEQWVKQYLGAEMALNEYDSLDEGWAQEFIVPISDKGVIQGKLTDLQARLPLNSLIDVNDEIRPELYIALQRLLEMEEIPITRADVVVDWLDANKSPENSAYSGEDDVYSSFITPFVAANTEMADSSELVQLNGFSYQSYQKLKPYVMAVPVSRIVIPVNVNTAPEKVLVALGIDDVAGLMTARPIRNRSELAPFIGDIDESYLSFQSQLFLLTLNAKFADVNIGLTSVLYRYAGQAHVLSRVIQYRATGNVIS